MRRPPGGELSQRWELPGGKVEADEEVRAALTRELHEELGVHATVGRRLLQRGFESRGRQFTVYLYEVTGSWDAIVLTEHTDAAWYTLHEALRTALVPSDRMLLEALAGDSISREID